MNAGDGSAASAEPVVAAGEGAAAAEPSVAGDVVTAAITTNDVPAAAAAPAAAPAAATTDGEEDAAAVPPPRIRVLDALTASGLRALRYIKEVEEVQSVVANDFDPQAVAALRENVRRNGLTEDVIVPSVGDAAAVMARSKPPDGPRFEAVELDPYGTAAPFLDGAMQHLRRRGWAAHGHVRTLTSPSCVRPIPRRAMPSTAPTHSRPSIATRR